jgi:hypothetical protein
MDFAIMNLIIFVISFLVYLAGGLLLETLIVLFFIISGLILILGGLFGFLLSGVLFWAYRKLFYGKEVTDDQKERAKEGRKTGDRLIILGAALLTESILLSLVMMSIST